MFIRTFIYSEINTFGLLKLSKISFAFNIFVLIPVQEMVHLKVIQKINPMDVSVSENIGQKTYLKKFRGVSAPLIRLCMWCQNLGKTQSCAAAHQRHRRISGLSHLCSRGRAQRTNRFMHKNTVTRVHTTAHWTHRNSRRDTRRTALEARRVHTASDPFLIQQGSTNTKVQFVLRYIKGGGSSTESLTIWNQSTYSM